MLIVAGALLHSVHAQAPTPAPAGGRQGARQGGAPAVAARRPRLFFKEEWKQTPAGGEHPVGFADLMPGSGHGPGGWGDVAQVEVYGRPVARTQ